MEYIELQTADFSSTRCA